jgi:DNA-binding NtrC family response regulator
MNRQRRDPLWKRQQTYAHADRRRNLGAVGSDGVELDPQAAVDLDLAADSDVSVLLTTGNGSHRAAWARTIHERSVRCLGPFVPVCGHAVPAANPPAADSDVKEWFECAAGGTLFIDHVWALTEEQQGRLLSLLTHQSLALNSTLPPHRNRDVRIISGSDRSLLTCVAIGTFSEVLFYRLNVIHVAVTANFSRRAS